MLWQEDIRARGRVLDDRLGPQSFRDDVQTALYPEVLEALRPAASDELGGVLFDLVLLDSHLDEVVRAATGAGREKA